MKHLLKTRLSAHPAFIIIALVFGLFFVLTTPLLWGADETTQLGRAYQVSEGHAHPEFFGIFHGGGYGGQLPNSFLKLVYFVNNDLTTNLAKDADGVARVHDPQGYRQLGAQKIGRAVTPYVFSNTAPYSPLAYLPSAIGLHAGSVLNLDIGHMIRLARLLDLAAYILIVWWALKTLRASSLKWIIFAVALLPMALFQASVISADTMTNAVSLLLVALFAKGCLTAEPFTMADKVTLGLAVISLPLLKPTYLPLIFLILLIPGIRLASNSRHVTYAKAAVLAVSLVLFGFWSYETRAITDTLRLVIPGPVWSTINPTLQEHFLLRHELSYAAAIARTFLLYDNAYFTQFFGLLGFNYVAIPAAGIMASFVALLLAVGLGSVGRQRIPKLKTAWIFVIVAASVGVMLTTFYVTLTSVGGGTIGGLQGRYFIPLAAPTMLGLALLLPKLRVNKADARQVYRQATVLLVALVVVSLTLSAVRYHYLTFG